MRILAFALSSLSLFVTTPVLADETPSPAATPSPSPVEKKEAERCDAHGVKKTLCTRCNAKLEPIFKKKGDWCDEHKRAESQCVLCHPELAKEGVK